MIKYKMSRSKFNAPQQQIRNNGVFVVHNKKKSSNNFFCFFTIAINYKNIKYFNATARARAFISSGNNFLFLSFHNIFNCGTFMNKKKKKKQKQNRKQKQICVNKENKNECVCEFMRKSLPLTISDSLSLSSSFFSSDSPFIPIVSFFFLLFVFVCSFKAETEEKK